VITAVFTSLHDLQMLTAVTQRVWLPASYHNITLLIERTSCRRKK